MRVILISLLSIGGLSSAHAQNTSLERDAEETIVAAITAVMGKRIANPRDGSPVIVIDGIKSITAMSPVIERQLGERVAARLRLPGRNLESVRSCQGTGTSKSCDILIDNVYMADVLKMDDSTASVLVNVSFPTGGSIYEVSLVRSGRSWSVKAIGAPLTGATPRSS